MKLYGVVVWYNPSKEDISNINTYVDGVEKLYIIDNSLNKNQYPKLSNVEYIFNGENIGVSKALNIAAKKAISEKADWLLTMDQDTIFNKECFEMFHKTSKDINTDKIAIITPWHNTKLKLQKPDKDIDYPQDVMTSGNFVNLKILEKLGYFRDDFFIDGIDIEYGLRLNSKGYKILRNNTVEIEHNLGDIKYHRFLGKDLLSHNHNYVRQYYMARNYRYINKEYKSIYPEFCNKLVRIKRSIFVILFYEKDKFRKIKYLFKGIHDFKKNKTGRIDE